MGKSNVRPGIYTLRLRQNAAYIFVIFPFIEVIIYERLVLSTFFI